MCAHLIPLTILALELPQTAAQLEQRFAEQVLVDDLGRVCVDRAVAKTLITDHRARVAAAERRQRERDEAHREALAAQTGGVRERVRAIQAQQEAQRATGEWDPDMSAFAVMCGQEHSERLQTAGDRFSEMLSAQRRGELGSGAWLRPRREEA